VRILLNTAAPTRSTSPESRCAEVIAIQSSSTDMSSLLLILLSTVLVNLTVLAVVSAWRPFAATNTVFDGALGLSVASLLTLPAVVLLSWLTAAWLLVPLDLQYLRTPAFVAIILIVVPLVEWGLRRQGRFPPSRPGFALLMTANATVLGTPLILASRMTSSWTALLASIGIAGALGALTLAFAALHERLRHADIPAVFRDAPIALVTAGIAALACMGFTGVIQE
jgi:H+/Na+-translocating ferredoxin:NAD+ oxidoreductase subunit A